MKLFDEQLMAMSVYYRREIAEMTEGNERLKKRIESLNEENERLITMVGRTKENMLEVGSASTSYSDQNPRIDAPVPVPMGEEQKEKKNKQISSISEGGNNAFHISNFRFFMFDLILLLINRQFQSLVFISQGTNGGSHFHDLVHSHPLCVRTFCGGWVTDFTRLKEVGCVSDTWELCPN
ncbi:hypothetical protein E3N88_14816 [Mikania micrantha]|uniref:Uncharacterized protein n=1 Tax=Mikania micrantha TaxID=192012 RepID=A0A5N6P536_9ASTR|nr:hypothetical protein E3N88_14816 [Mikania micrantha]